jgi:hypothetical protein
MSSRPPEDRPPAGRSRGRRPARHTYGGSPSGRPSLAARRAAARRRGLARLGILVAVVILIIVLVVAFASGGDKGGAATGGQGSSSPSASPTHSAAPVTGVLSTPTTAKPLRLKNYGDSMGGELGVALAPQVKEIPSIKYWTWYKVSSSLVRPDFFDWPKYLKNDLPSRHLHAAVFMVGTNDGQGIQLPSSVLKFETPAWRKEYASRVVALLKAFEQAGVKRVYWVGMPIMKSTRFSHVMSVVNQVAKAEVGRHKIARFVDISKLFATSSGTYDARWRQSDGVHFNIEGQNRLATAVLDVIKADWHIE